MLRSFLGEKSLPVPLSKVATSISHRSDWIKMHAHRIISDDCEMQMPCAPTSPEAITRPAASITKSGRSLRASGLLRPSVPALAAAAAARNRLAPAGACPLLVSRLSQIGPRGPIYATTRNTAHHSPLNTPRNSGAKGDSPVTKPALRAPRRRLAQAEKPG